MVLAVLVPVIAELAFGSTPPHLAYLVILWTPVYGAGVLLIREAVRRVGGGWPSLLLLGVAYELAEDGLGLQALTSPHLYATGHWGRIAGLNLAYWEANVAYHVVFTVLIPIALTEMLFPAHGRRPYLRRGGLVGTGICAVLGVALLRVAVPPSQDPGYLVPLPWLLGFLAAIVALAVLALRVLPRRGITGTVAATRPPRPVLLGLFGLATTLAFALPMFGLSSSPITHGALAVLPMTWSALVAVGSGALVRRWALETTGTLWLIGGLLVAHTAFGVVRVVHTVPDRIALSLIGVLTIVLLALLYRGRTTTTANPN